MLCAYVEIYSRLLTDTATKWAYPLSGGWEAKFRRAEGVESRLFRVRFLCARLCLCPDQLEFVR